MIADPAQVTALCINIKSTIQPVLMQTWSRIVDAQINGKLAGIYSEWIGLMNTDGPYPDMIVDIANLMTAGAIEKTKYAVNDAGRSQPNPYGVQLYKQGQEMLDQVIQAQLITLGLTRTPPIVESHPTGTFFPVGNLRTQGEGIGGYDRYAAGGFEDYDQGQDGPY